jgi:hypothetical protein
MVQPGEQFVSPGCRAEDVDRISFHAARRDDYAAL